MYDHVYTHKLYTYRPTKPSEILHYLEEMISV